MRDLGENGLSDYDGMDEDEAFPPLPPPHSPGQGGPDEGDPFANGEEEGDVSKLAEVPAAKRKGVRRPQPKLDSQRLISDRGLPALRTLFDDVHFKGKGHEAANLRLLMQKMENWAHRLYPKLQFEDFIDKVEKLGNKKEVQTCLKRIRLDMPLTDEDFIGKDGEDAAAAAASGFPVFSDPDPDPFGGSVFPDDLQKPIHSTPAPAAPPAPSPAPPSLTEEQRRRMEMNRQRALERRLARQQQTTTTDLSDSQTNDTPTSGEEPTSILNGSDHQSEEVEGVKGLDLEPVDSGSSRAEGAEQPLNKDSEPSAEPSQPEEEEETQTEATHQASDRCEDGE